MIDGDRKVRYLLVDAPETTNGHDDCYGDNATRFNSDLVLGKVVDLAYDSVCDDMYDRALAYVAVDGRDVNALMVQRGYARMLHIAPDGDARAAEFSAYEDEARAARRGLWGACEPVACR